MQHYSSIKINLTKGKQAIIDEDLFELVNSYKWCYSNSGYAMRGYREGNKVKTLLMHHLIIGIPLKGYEVDHINRNKLDNRKENLRVIPHSQNMKNQSKRKSKSGYTGVWLHKNTGKYEARITVDYKTIYLGVYNTAEEASEIYNQARQKYFDLNVSQKEG